MYLKIRIWDEWNKEWADEPKEYYDGFAIIPTSPNYAVAPYKASSISEAVGKMVESVYRSRIRYGGYDCLNWKKGESVNG